MNGRVVEASIIGRKSYRVGLSNVRVDQRRICGRVHVVSQAIATEHQSAVEGVEKLYLRRNEMECRRTKGREHRPGKDDAVAWALCMWLQLGASEEGPRYAQRDR